MSELEDKFRILRDLFYESLLDNQRITMQEQAASVKREGQVNGQLFEEKPVVSNLGCSVEGIREYTNATKSLNSSRANALRAEPLGESSVRSKTRKPDVRFVQHGIGSINKRNMYFNLKLKRFFNANSTEKGQAD
jgi:hypothetical protein